MINKIFQIYAYLFSRRIFSRINRFIFNLSLRGLGVYNYNNAKLSGENSFLKKISNDPNKQMTFIDIGANIGNFANHLKQLYPNAIIYAFEPHPKTFQVLTKNIQNGIIPVNKAVSNNIGKTHLYDYEESAEGSEHASIKPNVIEGVHHSRSVTFEVNTITLDEFITSSQIDKIDFIKIDVEGNELDVIKGLSETLKMDMIDIIQFEFTQINSTTKVFMLDFFQLLNDKYSLYRLLPYELLPLGQYSPTEHEIFGYQNIVALRRNSDVENRLNP